MPPAPSPRVWCGSGLSREQGAGLPSSRAPGQCRSWREGRTSERGADVCGGPAPTRTHWLLLRAGAWGPHGVNLGSLGPWGWGVGPQGAAPCASVSSLEGQQPPSGAQDGGRHSEEAQLKIPATPCWRGRQASSSEVEDTRGHSLPAGGRPAAARVWGSRASGRSSGSAAGVLPGQRQPRAQPSPWVGPGKPNLPSGCDGKLGVALESLQCRRDLI